MQRRIFVGYFIVVKIVCAASACLVRLHHPLPSLHHHRRRLRQSEPSCPSFSLSVFVSEFAWSHRRLLRRTLASLRVRHPLRR